MKKAFDYVPDPKLLCKLSSFGINSDLHKWVGIFLPIARMQQARIGLSLSFESQVISGIIRVVLLALCPSYCL
jgi:hypothetical protein